MPRLIAGMNGVRWTAEEVALLLDTTKHGSTWRGMSGADRAMLYRLAVGTGFRATELRSLTPGSFHLDTDRPSVTVQAADSKHRCRDTQPIRQDLADLLRPWLADKPGGTPVFGVPERTAEMIRMDLRRARARWIRAAHNLQERRERWKSDTLRAEDSDGRVVDFHSLRVSYVTWLVQGGASVKAAQELARHSDPKLTLNVYTKLGIHDLAGTLDALPSLPGNRLEREAVALRATGTDDAQACQPGAPDHTLHHTQHARETTRSGATACKRTGTTASTPKSQSPLKTSTERNEAQRGATECGTAPGRTRTSDPRFRKPMLYPLSYERLAACRACRRVAAPGL